MAVCIDNGYNNCLILKGAALEIAVFEGEGGAVEAITFVYLVTVSILDTLDLLVKWLL